MLKIGIIGVIFLLGVFFLFARNQEEKVIRYENDDMGI